jgi:hypothetical protein
LGVWHFVLLGQQVSPHGSRVCEQQTPFSWHVFPKLQHFPLQQVLNGGQQSSPHTSVPRSDPQHVPFGVQTLGAVQHVGDEVSTPHTSSARQHVPGAPARGEGTQTSARLGRQHTPGPQGVLHVNSQLPLLHVPV